MAAALPWVAGATGLYGAYNAKRQGDAQQSAIDSSNAATDWMRDLYRQAWEAGAPQRQGYNQLQGIMTPYTLGLARKLLGVQGSPFVTPNPATPATNMPVVQPTPQTPAATTPATPAPTQTLQQWMASQKDIIPEVWNRMTPAQQLANAKKMGYNPQASQTLQTGTTPQSGTQTGTGYNPNYHPADSGNDMYTDPNGGHGYYPGGQAAHDAATGGTTAQPYAEAAYQTPWWENLTAFDPNSLPTQPTTNWGALLPGVPDPEAEAAKIQAAYDSLAGINRQDLRRQMENNSASDLARRGLGTSSLSENTGNAMDLWALTQEAKDRAQGLQAGRQWAQNLRGEKTNQLDLARGWQNQDYNTAMQRTITGEGLAAQRRGEASGNWWQNMNYLLGQQNTLGQSMNPSVFGAGMGSVANQYGNSAANLGGGNNNIFGSLLGGWAANQNNTAKPANITVNSGGGTSQPWSSGNTYANSAYTQSSGYKAPSWLGNNNFSVSF